MSLGLASLVVEYCVNPLSNNKLLSKVYPIEKSRPCDYADNNQENNIGNAGATENSGKKMCQEDQNSYQGNRLSYVLHGYLLHDIGIIGSLLTFFYEHYVTGLSKLQVGRVVFNRSI